MAETRNNNAAAGLVPLFLKDPNGWAIYDNCRILRPVMGYGNDNGFIKAFEVHDGTNIRTIERNEFANRNLTRMNEFLEPRADVPRIVRFTECKIFVCI